MGLSLVPRAGAADAPTGDTCPTCGKPVDPLRAGHVALLGERFHYFCNQDCRARFLDSEPHRARMLEETREPPAVASRPQPITARSAPASTPRPLTPTPPPVAAYTPSPTQTSAPSSPSPRLLVARPARQLTTREVHVVTDEPPAVRQRESSRTLSADASQSLLVRPLRRAPVAHEEPGPWLGSLLTLCALGASLLGASSSRIGERGPEVALGAILLALALEIVQRARARRRPTVRAVLAFLPLLAAVGVAGVAAESEAPASALSTVGLLVFGYVAMRALGARVHRETELEVRALTRALAASHHQVGDVVEIHAPAFVPVDGVVVRGSGELRPNGARMTAQPLHDGDLVFAGGKLTIGSIEVRAERVGDDRSFTQLFAHGSLQRLWPARYTVIERALLVGTLLASLTTGLFAWVSREEPWHPFLLAATTAAIVGMLHGLELPRLMWARGVLATLERGVMFPSFTLYDRASFVEQVVLAGRGVVFAGAPQFVDIVWLGADHDRELVLAEIAGAEARSTHPLGTCLHTALVSRGVEPGSMRKVEERPGLGVVARTRANAELIVGNRELLLRNAISMAGVEARALEYESERRELLYVARGGRLCAFAVFEDSLRDGSFAAVQALLATGIEPVMVSGSSQTVCEAAGRSLEIDHVRSEVLPDERAFVVRSLIESGRVVGMIGSVPRDEDALMEADVGLAFGSAPTRVPASLARTSRSDLEAATYVLVQARRLREAIGKMVLVALILPLVAGLAAGFGLCTPAVMPLAGMVGLAFALVVGRNWLFSPQNPLPKVPSPE